MTRPSPETSASLLEQAREPQSAAWPRLVAIYTPLLQQWLIAVGVQAADRDDLCQRVMEVLLRQIKTFEHSGRTGAFRAWLRGVITNLLREYWRGHPAGGDGVLAELVDPKGGLSQVWDAQHDRHVLHSLMSLVRPEFTEPTWIAFRRIALEGAAAATVAEELGLSVNAVLIAKSRVLSRLRQEARGLVDT
jgi:RNA polymerase sigma-70 factor (ECF subfamily)